MSAPFRRCECNPVEHDCGNAVLEAEVERLKGWVEVGVNYKRKYEQAEAEVERLRADVMDEASESEMRKQNQGLRERAEQAEAEVERLRAEIEHWQKRLDEELQKKIVLRNAKRQAEARLARVVEALHEIEDMPCLPSEPTAILLRKMAGDAVLAGAASEEAR